MNQRDPDGPPGDSWIFEDKLIYVHKKFVAIPLEATSDGDVSRSARTVMKMTAVTYDDTRPGCYNRDVRIKDVELNRVDGTLPFPTITRFCGQAFMEADGPISASRASRCTTTGCTQGSSQSSPSSSWPTAKGQIGWIPYALERADTE